MKEEWGRDGSEVKRPQHLHFAILFLPSLASVDKRLLWPLFLYCEFPNSLYC